MSSSRSSWLTCSQFIKQEDTNKYRCKVPECTKLFKGVDFWRKHVEKRHAEWYDRMRQDVELVNTYVLDPAHIAPSRTDANSNGHFPLSNQMPTGTPRGFQLSQQLPMGFPMPAGLPSAVAPGAGLPMFAAPNGVPMPIPSWSPAGFTGGVGPMRNMGRNNFGGMNGYGRMPGPYARNDGRGRMPAMGGGRGPVTFGIGGLEGGAGAMGPREAVLGRQIRSYEDLDADKGEGTGELNY